MKKEEIESAVKKASDKYIGKMFVEKLTYRKVFVKAVSSRYNASEWEVVLQLYGLEDPKYHIEYPLDGLEDFYTAI